jgi:phosphotransferase system enzyme I (PtsI)
VKRELAPRLPDSELAIFDTHAVILRDAAFVQEIEREIRTRGVSAEVAVIEVVGRAHAAFSSSTVPTVQDKAADILDIGKRISRCLQQAKATVGNTSDQNVVIVASTILPSELVQLSHQNVAALVLEHCGLKSHTAILARGLGVPVVAGISSACIAVPQHRDILVDATAGRVIINASPEQRTDFERRFAETGGRIPCQAAHAKPVTCDGTRIRLLLNVSDSDEADAVAQLEADGIGLFRTEFLYMDRDHWLSEDDAYAVYSQVAGTIGDRELHIRLADFGAEKCPAYADLPINRNPSLGLRGLRLLLQREDILAPQVRALARVARERPMTILLPMVDTPDTLEVATRTICRLLGCTARVELPFQIGAMIELPAAAIMIDDLIGYVDSVAIGLNDLTQYVLAADRDDEFVEFYHDATQPAVLRLVSKVVCCADACRKPVTMCGELAGDPSLTGLLLALGLRRLSVSRTSFSAVAETISGVSVPALAAVSPRISSLNSGKEVRRLITSPPFRPLRANEPATASPYS